MTSESETNAIAPIENDLCPFTLPGRADAPEDEAAPHHVPQETPRDGLARSVAMAVLEAPSGSGDAMLVGAGLPDSATRRPVHDEAVLVAAEGRQNRVNRPRHGPS